LGAEQSWRTLQDISPKHPKLIIKETGPEAEKLQVRVTVTAHGEVKHAWPIPPLDYGIALNDQPHDFTGELNEIATEGKAQDALAYVKRMANRRNQVLYAHTTGIPVAQEDDGFLESTGKTSLCCS
jgi:hypothetical protein